ncbi:unnamed protein product, partial [Mesorhabditis belari]|uniref:Uncharacterized protein n=1 Tax=Mesorhabditis belari TaxID=2138241 RepID=A0AAF3F2R3_9BILA
MEMASINALIDNYKGEEAFKRLTEIQPTVDDNRWVAFSYRFAQVCYIRFNQWSEEKKQAERLELIRREERKQNGEDGKMEKWDDGESYFFNKGLQEVNVCH